jgi:hypothetical protein
MPSCTATPRRGAERWERESGRGGGDDEMPVGVAAADTEPFAVSSSQLSHVEARRCERVPEWTDGKEQKIMPYPFFFFSG